MTHAERLAFLDSPAEKTASLEFNGLKGSTNVSASGAKKEAKVNPYLIVPELVEGLSSAENLALRRKNTVDVRNPQPNRPEVLDELGLIAWGKPYDQVTSDLVCTSNPDFLGAKAANLFFNELVGEHGRFLAAVDKWSGYRGFLGSSGVEELVRINDDGTRRWLKDGSRAVYPVKLLKFLARAEGKAVTWFPHGQIKDRKATSLPGTMPDFIGLEIDDGCLNEQLARLVTLQQFLGTKFLMLWSGKKSIHFYIPTIDHPESRDQYYEVLKTAISVTGGDYAVASAGRALRMAGAFRAVRVGNENVITNQSIMQLGSRDLSFSELNDGLLSFFRQEYGKDYRSGKDWKYYQSLGLQIVKAPKGNNTIDVTGRKVTDVFLQSDEENDALLGGKRAKGIKAKKVKAKAPKTPVEAVATQNVEEHKNLRLAQEARIAAGITGHGLTTEEILEVVSDPINQGLTYHQKGTELSDRHQRWSILLGIYHSDGGTAEERYELAENFGVDNFGLDEAYVAKELGSTCYSIGLSSIIRNIHGQVDGTWKPSERVRTLVAKSKNAANALEATNISEGLASLGEGVVPLLTSDASQLDTEIELDNVKLQAIQLDRLTSLTLKGISTKCIDSQLRPEYTEVLKDRTIALHADVEGLGNDAQGLTRLKFNLMRTWFALEGNGCKVLVRIDSQKHLYTSLNELTGHLSKLINQRIYQHTLPKLQDRAGSGVFNARYMAAGLIDGVKLADKIIEIHQDESKSNLFALSGPTGTGKTTLVEQLLELLECKKFYAAPLKILALENGAALATDRNDEQAAEYEGLGLGDISACLQGFFNFGRFEKFATDKVVVFIDETDRVILDLLGSTHATQRQANLNQLKRILDHAKENDWPVIIAQQNLSEIAVRFFEWWMDVEANVFVNQYKEQFKDGLTLTQESYLGAVSAHLTGDHEAFGFGKDSRLQFTQPKSVRRLDIHCQSANDILKFQEFTRPQRYLKHIFRDAKAKQALKELGAEDWDKYAKAPLFEIKAIDFSPEALKLWRFLEALQQPFWVDEVTDQHVLVKSTSKKDTAGNEVTQHLVYWDFSPVGKYDGWIGGEKNHQKLKVEQWLETQDKGWTKELFVTQQRYGAPWQELLGMGLSWESAKALIRLMHEAFLDSKELVFPLFAATRDCMRSGKKTKELQNVIAEGTKDGQHLMRSPLIGTGLSFYGDALDISATLVLASWGSLEDISQALSRNRSRPETIVYAPRVLNNRVALDITQEWKDNHANQSRKNRAELKLLGKTGNRFNLNDAIACFEAIHGRMEGFTYRALELFAQGRACAFACAGGGTLVLADNWLERFHKDRAFFGEFFNDVFLEWLFGSKFAEDYLDVLDNVVECEDRVYEFFVFCAIEQEQIARHVEVTGSQSAKNLQGWEIKEGTSFVDALSSSKNTGQFLSLVNAQRMAQLKYETYHFAECFLDHYADYTENGITFIERENLKEYNSQGRVVFDGGREPDEIRSRQGDVACILENLRTHQYLQVVEESHFIQSEAEARRIKNSPTSTVAEQRAADLALLRLEYPESQWSDPDFIYYTLVHKNGQLRSCATRLARYLLNSDLFTKDQCQKFKRDAANGDHLHGVLRGTLREQIFINDSGVADFYRTHGRGNNISEAEVRESQFWAYLVEHQQELWDLFQLQTANDSPIAVINRLVKRLSYDPMPCVARTGNGGSQRRYAAIVNKDVHEIRKQLLRGTVLYVKKQIDDACAKDCVDARSLADPLFYNSNDSLDRNSGSYPKWFLEFRRSIEDQIAELDKLIE
ncbi:hypothetical protein AM1_0239 [Acaryochloris marina MBIC11017]|uniref:AAA+ ATPase domain-containing protein n=2 Tax=Acaryochloris marina TaxID=155978 RepID=B0C8T5_ACAM1|nr:hypothetical protein AM1_0239 [Acaryochloris marina MBIC11017]